MQGVEVFKLVKLPLVMYNYEWNSHLMGRFLGPEHFCNYLDCFCASSILFTFCWFLSYCMFFPHVPCIFYHHLKSHIWTFCRGPPFDVQRTGSGFDPKGGQPSSQVLTILVTLEFSPFPQVTSNIVALAFSVQHFLAVGTLEKKVGKEKHAKKHRFVVQRTWEYWTFS